MPPLRLLKAITKARAAIVPARMIWRSRWMRLGVACEILAFAAAMGNWYDNPWLVWQFLPNIALTLATSGAVIVACKVAWDYQGRGLNERQREEIGTTLANASLSDTQIAEVSAAVQSSGLTQRQKSELRPALQGIELAGTVFAQKAISDAANQLHGSDHGYVAVVKVNMLCEIEVQCVAPPTGPGKCQRQHEFEPESKLDLLDVAKSLPSAFHHPAYLWKQPVTGELRHTNRNDPASFTKELVFSLEDCVPKWRIPIAGDYVLTPDTNDYYRWQQKT